MDGTPINTTEMAIGLPGGLAIFLFGLEQLTDMMKQTAGARLRDMLARAKPKW